MQKALKRHGSPEAITTGRLRSYGAAMKEPGNADRQKVGRWANNRVSGRFTFMNEGPVSESD